MPPARAPKGAPRKRPAPTDDASPPPQQSPSPEVEDEEEEPAKKIPEELVARVMHEFFKREDTRVSRAASRALGRYFEIFVQEAIARTKQERGGRFLEVGPLSFSPLFLLGRRGCTEGVGWGGFVNGRRLRIWKRLRRS